MNARRNRTAIVRDGWLRAANILLCCFFVRGVLPAQDHPNSAFPFLPQSPAVQGVLAQTQFTQFPLIKSGDPGQRSMTKTVDLAPSYLESTATSAAPRRITLLEAQQQAAGADNPMVRLGHLQVEAARQHRLAAESDYFPKLSSTFTNVHFNKFMGEQIPILNVHTGQVAAVGLPLAGKDQTLVAATGAQPITPLFKLREVVRLARADENIARAKAGLPVTETAANVEKNYYELLVAQRQLLIAKANAENLRGRQLLASNALVPGDLSDHTAEEMESDKTLVMAENKVNEFTVSLNLLLDFPVETELELVTPTTQFEEISLKDASDKAMAANPELVEAEQTVVKARAASKLSKLDYVPDFVLLGGYVYNSNAVPLLPRDFSFIGVMGSFNLFDFGKREHTVKERNAQVAMAETALQLTKVKVSAAVKNSFFELDRSRQLSDLAHRMASTLQIERTSYSPNDSQLTVTRAKLEVEMLQADLDYRQALERLKTLMGER